MSEQLITRYSDLPSVTSLLTDFESEAAPHHVLVTAIRSALDSARAQITQGAPASEEQIRVTVKRELDALQVGSPRRVINATGVVLHTNLGRAVLSDDARHAMMEAAAYANVELDLEEGTRGHRDAHVEKLLVQLTGAEAATIVNNCAGALVLALSALARDREVVVSRGQAVEIGGRFRIPDVCEQSGAVLREVGTTNRTYASDYATACSERTAVLLRVHLSNFRMQGFVAEASVEELALVAREHGVWLLDDLGSGALVDTAQLGLRHEPTVQESVRAGADVTMFSGDKLLGGPQAGLLIGRREAIQKIRRHPLARALRCDKVTLSAMHATLRHYMRGDHMHRIPTLAMLATTEAQVRDRAERWKGDLQAPGTEVLSCAGAVGAGSIPVSHLPSAALVIDPAAYVLSADELSSRLRRASTPVIGRIEQDRVWLDPRTVQLDEEADLLEAVRCSLESPSNDGSTGKDFAVRRQNP